ncbi:MAG: hypothetical protein K9J17_09525 [Flavobacteriales bacterium]|nr:hypothetical protein [Flavobacteriales bacterium]
MKKAMMMVGIAAVMLTTTTGCKKTCDDWYELEDKDCVEMREKFYGYYVGVYTQNGQTSNGALELSELSGNVQRIRLTGSSNYFELTGSNSFDMPLQQVVDVQTYTMEGSGSLSGNQITFNATQTLNGQTVILNFTGSK